MYVKRTRDWILYVLVRIEGFLMDDIKSDKLDQLDHTELLKYVNLHEISAIEYFSINGDNAGSSSDSDLSENYEGSESISSYMTTDTTMNDFLNDIGDDYLTMIEEKHGITQESMAESSDVCIKYCSILIDIIEQYLIIKTNDIIIKRLFIDDFIDELGNIVNNMEYFNIFDNKNNLIENICKKPRYNDWRCLGWYPNMIIKMYEADIGFFNKITMIHCGCKYDYSKLSIFPIEIMDTILVYLLQIAYIKNN